MNCVMRQRRPTVPLRFVLTTMTLLWSAHVLFLIPVHQFDFETSALRSTGLVRCLLGFADPPEAHELFATVMRINLMAYWFERQGRPRPDLARYATEYDKMHAFLERSDIGFGVERAMYKLNPNQPFLSPFLERDYVTSMDDLFPAIERVAQQRKGEINQYIDRHIGAFIAARFRILVNSELHDMDNRADKYTPIVAAAKLLSSV
jgi:hypothetical protein